MCYLTCLIPKRHETIAVPVLEAVRTTSRVPEPVVDEQMASDLERELANKD